MSKEEIIKAIEEIDELLKQNQEVGFVYIPTSKLLMNIRNMWVDMLLYEYGIFYMR